MKDDKKNFKVAKSAFNKLKTDPSCSALVLFKVCVGQKKF